MALMIGLERFDCLLTIVHSVPHPDGAALQLFRSFGKRMSLEIMDHLQLMFDIAQEQISGGQRIALIDGEQFFLSQPVQRTERAAIEKRRDFSPSQDLNGLYEKLDLSNPADPQLHIALCM